MSGFCVEVDKGLVAAQHGELVDHAEVGKLIRDRYLNPLAARSSDSAQ
jgi:hypothetical protein